MGMNLFEDDDAGNVDDSRIEINKEFARRFEYNKKREDLQRYEELKKKGQIEESSESDESESSDESGTDIANTKRNIEYFEKLLKVKNRDPSLYQNAQLFQSDSDNDGDSDAKRPIEKKQKKSALYLKDVAAQHLMEEGPDFDEEELDDNKKKRRKTYTEEQEELRKELLDAVNSVPEDDDDDDFLKVKERRTDGNGVIESEGDDGEYDKKLKEYFDGEDEGTKFLMEYFRDEKWLDKGPKDKEDVEVEDLDDVLRDEEEIERQEKYEEGYNFRYEEKAGDRVMGHSRKVEGSVRKKDNARKEQRKSKEERMKIAEMERKEELKHLKNLKKKEMEEKLKKVMDAAGIDDCPLDLNDLEEEFNPEEYDEMMNKVFNEKYYTKEDVDPDFGSNSDDDCEIEKPDFDKEDELLGLPKDWDVTDSGDGFLATREKILKLKAQNADDDNHQEETNEEETGEESKRKRKRKMSLMKKVKEEMMEEYYKLDYEDTIGDLRTRFKYAKVPPNRYGLKASEILMLDESELNQYVSIKKLAPYREKEWKVPHSKRNKFKEALQEKSIHKKKSKLKHTSALESGQDKGKEVDKPDVDTGKESRKAKRKHRLKELKLGPSRLIAYGKLQPKAKDKGKR